MRETVVKEQSERAQRPGVVVTPECRLSEDQVRLIDGLSRDMLEDPGILCYNRRAAEIFGHAGAQVTPEAKCARVRIPGALIDRILASAPSRIVLGAREPGNRLVLDAHEPRVRFGSGAETNVWLDVSFAEGRPAFHRRSGSIGRLIRAAHLAEHLEHLDFFIRCVNICDEEITFENKDVNKFLASLNNITKHVQAGLTNLACLDDVIRLGEIIAGGPRAFRENPVLSFITCVIKSPLQMVDDTAEKLIEISRRGAPVVISSCPMGGATGPFDEFGMVSLINAELLAGIALNQLVSPGCPVLYGAVPVRTRLDNLNDMYGAPEFVQYNKDCAQMARFYGLPCYSTAGVGDADRPGIQATFEKMMTLMTVPRAGAQYIHYAFGLLERTNMFCPEQAIIDNESIGACKQMLAEPDISPQAGDGVLEMIRGVMNSDHKTFMYHLPLPTRQQVYVRYPLEHADGGTLRAAHERYHEILNQPPRALDPEMQRELLGAVPGILPHTLKDVKGDWVANDQ